MSKYLEVYDDTNQDAWLTKLEERVADGGMARVAGSRLEVAESLGYPFLWVFPEDVDEVVRVARLIEETPGGWDADALWDFILPREGQRDAEGQAILSLDVLQHGEHITWSVLFFNLPDVVEGLRDLALSGKGIIFTREPLGRQDYRELPNFAVALPASQALSHVLDVYRQRAFI